MINLEEKKKIVKDLKSKLDGAKFSILVDYSGLSTFELNELRGALREKNVDYIVAKKTLMKRAGFDTKYQGPVAVAISQDDEVAPAKVLYNFSKDHEALAIIEGLLDGQPVDLTKIEELAKLSSREDLLGMLVMHLKGNINKLILILKQHAGKEEGN